MPLPPNLLSQIEHLLELAAASFHLLKPEIDRLLASESPKVEDMDHLLDSLYPAYSMGKDQGAYRVQVEKLATIDPEAAKFYQDTIS